MQSGSSTSGEHFISIHKQDEYESDDTVNNHEEIEVDTSTNAPQQPMSRLPTQVHMAELRQVLSEAASVAHELLPGTLSQMAPAHDTGNTDHSQQSLNLVNTGDPIEESVRVFSHLRPTMLDLHVTTHNTCCHSDYVIASARSLLTLSCSNGRNVVSILFWTVTVSEWTLT